MHSGAAADACGRGGAGVPRHGAAVPARGGVRLRPGLRDLDRCQPVDHLHRRCAYSLSTVMLLLRNYRNRHCRRPRQFCVSFWRPRRRCRPSLAAQIGLRAHWMFAAHAVRLCPHTELYVCRRHHHVQGPAAPGVRPTPGEQPFVQPDAPIAHAGHFSVRGQGSARHPKTHQLHAVSVSSGYKAIVPCSCLLCIHQQQLHRVAAPEHCIILTYPRCVPGRRSCSRHTSSCKPSASGCSWAASCSAPRASRGARP